MQTLKGHKILHESTIINGSTVIVIAFPASEIPPEGLEPPHYQVQTVDGRFSICVFAQQCELRAERKGSLGVCLLFLNSVDSR